MLRYKTEPRPGLAALYDIGRETERVNSYNPGKRLGKLMANAGLWNSSHIIIHWMFSDWVKHCITMDAD